MPVTTEHLPPINRSPCNWWRPVKKCTGKFKESDLKELEKTINKSFKYFRRALCQ